MWNYILRERQKSMQAFYALNNRWHDDTMILTREKANGSLSPRYLRIWHPTECRPAYQPRYPVYVIYWHSWFNGILNMGLLVAVSCRYSIYQFVYVNPILRSALIFGRADICSWTWDILVRDISVSQRILFKLRKSWRGQGRRFWTRDSPSPRCRTWPSYSVCFEMSESSFPNTRSIDMILYNMSYEENVCS